MAAKRKTIEEVRLLNDMAIIANKWKELIEKNGEPKHGSSDYLRRGFDRMKYRNLKRQLEKLQRSFKTPGEKDIIDIAKDVFGDDIEVQNSS